MGLVCIGTASEEILSLGRQKRLYISFFLRVISAKDKLCFGFVARTPREHIVYFGGNQSIDPMKGTVVAMPKLRGFHLISPILDPVGP